MEELKALLEQRIIRKSENRELYYAIKDQYNSMRDFVVNRLGYNFVVRGDFIKLEKIPGQAQSWMGIDEFDHKREYIFLMILLVFLENREREGKFLLSHITEFIMANSVGEKVDWTNYSTRRSLIKVLRFAVNEGLIDSLDGEESGFLQDGSHEVLFENTGLSRYFVRDFQVDVLQMTDPKELIEEKVAGLEQDKGVVRRHRVYRRLLLSPIVYNGGADDEDYAYIKQNRENISETLERYLGWTLHVHRNGAMVVIGDTDRVTYQFPSMLAISDIVLQINSEVIQRIRSKQWTVATNDTLVLERGQFRHMIEQVRDCMSHGWSKEYREASLDKLENEICRYMEQYCMIEAQGEDIVVFPIVGKIVGEYMSDYQGGKKDGE